MKVTMLVPPQSFAGGVGTAVDGLVGSLTSAGLVTPAVVCLKQPAPRFDPFGYSVARLIRETMQTKPQVLHTHGLWVTHSRAGARLAYKQELPEIISPHGMLDEWALGHQAVKKRLALALYERSHLRSGRVIHALCDAERKSLRRLGVNSTIALIPNGVALPPTGLTDPAPWNGKFAPGVKVLLFLGRLHAKKGLDPLLRAWAFSEKSLVAAGWGLALVGWDDGGYAEVCEDLIEDLKISGSCRWFGPATGRGKDAAFSNCSAFILPSFSEGLPMSVLEAWSHGRPVLMTEECNLPAGFQAGAAGKITREVRLLAGQLNEFLVKSPSSALFSMGQAGRNLVTREYQWGAVASKFAQVYRWVLHGGPQPDFVEGSNFVD